MKSSTKRLLSVVLVLAMALSMLPMIAFADAPTTLYVKPNANWLQGNARFAAYFFGAGEKWVDCTDADGDGVYEVVLPSGGYTHIIFCRMNGGAAANNWNNKWNQTSDLPLPKDDSKPLYVVAENTWDKGKGQWVEYAPGGEIVTEPTTKSPIEYSVAGEAGLCGTAWTPDEIANMMTDADKDGIYTITYTEVAAGSYKFKVTDGTWNNAWPAQDYVLKLDAKSNVTISFNTADKTVAVDIELLEQPVETEPTQPVPATYIVAGTAELCGVAWTPNEASNQMTDADGDGIYTITFTAVAAGEHAFKVTDGTWDNAWPGEDYKFTTVSEADVTINFNAADKTIEVVSDGIDVPVTEPFVPGVREYCLVGYINGADYGCNEDFENVGEYIFVDGKLTASFTADSYIFVKTTDNANWLLTDAFSEGPSATFVTGGAEKMKVPGGAEVVFTLVENEDGSVTVSYDIGQQIPTDPTSATEPVAAEYFVAGTVNGWNEKDEAFKMIGNEGIYTLTFAVTAGDHALKVTDGTWINSWGGDGPDGNYVFTASADGEVTVTFDGTTVTVTGDVIVEKEKEELVINSVHVAGTADLTGAEWDPAANAMTAADGIYTITFENVAAGTYEFKFTANGSWDLNWASGAVMENEVVYDAYKNAMGNSSVVVPGNGATVTLTLDLTAMDIYTGDGAKCSVVVSGGVIAPKEYCLVGYINGADYGCNDDYQNVGEYIFVDGKLTATFTADSYIFVKTTDNANWYLTEAYTEDTTATFVAGASEKMKVPAGVEITFTLVENENGSVTVSYVAASAGYAVNGAVVTGAAGETTVELLKDGEVIATTTAVTAAEGKVITGNYAFENIAAGTYTLKVSKENHVAREYTVTVEADLTQDTKIHLIGDIDGNGKINVGDVSKLNGHIKGNQLTDEYMILCANVNGGKLNMGDVSVLYAHIKGTKKLY